MNVSINSICHKLKVIKHRLYGAWRIERTVKQKGSRMKVQKHHCPVTAHPSAIFPGFICSRDKAYLTQLTDITCETVPREMHSIWKAAGIQIATTTTNSAV